MQETQETQVWSPGWEDPMEKYTMFMDQKNQYSENEYTTQSNI